MFVLGLLSIIQAGFLPGYLLVRLLRLNEGRFRTSLLAFSLSLLINHLFVSGAAALGLYGRPAVFTLLALEIAALLYLVLRGPRRPMQPPPDLVRLRDAIEGRGRAPESRLVMWAALLSVIPALVWWVNTATPVFGSVFRAWDAIVSYNRWALEWAEGRVPVKTWLYPQVWPTTIALTYTFTGAPNLQFFATAFATLFPLAIIIALLDLTLRLRDPRYALAAWPCACILHRTLHGAVMVGMTDDQAAAATLLALYPLILAAHERHWPAARALLITGALAAAAAGLVKQAGWNIAAVYPVLAYGLVLSAHPELNPRRRGLWAVWLVLLIAIPVAPWYIYRATFPFSQTGLQYLLEGIHAGRTYPQRAARAVVILADAIGVPIWLLCATLIIGLLGALTDRIWRWITLLIVLPSGLIWAFLLSYDARTGATAFIVAIPALIVGFSRIPGLIGGLAVRAPRSPRLARAVVAAGFVLAAGAALILSATHFRASRLLREQDRLQRRAFDAEVNAALYRYVDEFGLEYPVLTNYQVMGGLPELSRFYKHNGLASDLWLKKELPEARFVFYYGSTPPPPPVASAVAVGKLTLLASGPRHKLFRVNP